MARVGGAGFELGYEVEIERAGVVVLGVDDETAAANVPAEGEEACDRVDEESGSEAVALVWVSMSSRASRATGWG